MSNFDYETLPLEKRIVIQQSAVEIKERLRLTALTIWEIGEKLVKVRSQLEPRQFIPWLKFEFGWSQRTAYNFINVYQAFPDLPNSPSVNIALSGLYNLAAPSTPQKIRDCFLEKAKAGEPITHKTIQKAIKEAKQLPTKNDVHITETNIFDTALDEDNTQYSQRENTEVLKSQESSIEDPRLELHGVNANTLDVQASKLEPEAVNCALEAGSSNICPGWNMVKTEFLLFWGDTASPRFIERLPKEAGILAIPSSHWHHDWLFSKSRNYVVILNKALLKEGLIDSLLSELAQREKAVILPWLPNWRIIELAIKMDIKVYAGDLDLKHCEKVLSKLKLEANPINL